VPDLYVVHPSYFRNNLTSMESLIRGMSVTRALKEYMRDHKANPTPRSYKRLQTLAVLAAKEANQ